MNPHTPQPQRPPLTREEKREALRILSERRDKALDSLFDARDAHAKAIAEGDAAAEAKCAARITEANLELRNVEWAISKVVRGEA